MRYIPATVVLALSGTSYGFVVDQLTLPAGGNITPSSGVFANYASGYACGPGSVVRDRHIMWWAELPYIIFDTTWLALDSHGGGPDASVEVNSFSRILNGLVPANPNPVSIPEVSGSLAFWEDGAGTQGVDAGLLEGLGGYTGSSFQGGPSGFSWGGASGGLASAVSPVNGVSVDSMFFGNFVLSDLNAVLTGTDLIVTIDGVQRALAWDGQATPTSGGYAIAYERYMTYSAFVGPTQRIKAFIVVPSPGPLSLAGLGVLALTRRCRRA